MSKLMTTRWPLTFFAQFLLTMGVHSLISFILARESSGIWTLSIMSGVIGLVLISAIATFALRGVPYLPNRTINPIYRSSMAPVCSHPSEHPFSFVAELFMVPIFAVPTTEIVFLFDVNDARQYAGVLIGLGVFLLSYLADFVYQRISVKHKTGVPN